MKNLEFQYTQYIYVHICIPSPDQKDDVDLTLVQIFIKYNQTF